MTQRRIEDATTRIMAVINVTPDSFSGDGTLLRGGDYVANALARANEAVRQGAAMLDIGGVASYPGAPQVDVEEEARRVLPAIKTIAREISTPLSIDTYRATIAADAIALGASIVNSYWGLRFPSGEWNTPMIRLIAESDAKVIVAHNRLATVTRSSFGNHYTTNYNEPIVRTVLRELDIELDHAAHHGITDMQIIIDPGIGQGKTPAQNLELLANLDEFAKLGYPVLIAASRKSFIGSVLHVPPHERDAATAGITALAAFQGVSIIRAHNVEVNVHAAAIASAISAVRRPKP
jgi:dihydropteroate synthase